MKIRQKYSEKNQRDKPKINKENKFVLLKVTKPC